MVAERVAPDGEQNRVHVDRRHARLGQAVEDAPRQ